FFFFQAEDGIRDKLVTGVQTCALPICSWGFGSGSGVGSGRGGDGSGTGGTGSGAGAGSGSGSGGTGGCSDAGSGSKTVTCDGGEIGRASCRERVEIGEGGGARYDRAGQ